MTQALKFTADPVADERSKPCRMLHIFPSFELGGQQSRFAAIANGLGGSFHHTVISLDAALDAQSLLAPEAPVEFTSFPAKKSQFVNLGNLNTLKTLIQRHTPDILCTYNWGSLEACLANKLFCHVPHIHFEDGFGDDETPIRQMRRRVVTRNIVLRGATVVTPSRELTEIARNKWGLKTASVIHIPNGVDYARFQLSPNVHHGEVRVGTVGALRIEKRFDRLILALNKADKTGVARLVIVGDGPDRMRLRDVTEKEKLVKRVMFTGACATPESYYRDFDIFALSSQTEQAPLTVLEAMAAGLPIISTDVGDICSMVCAENRAFITKLGDDEAYSNALSHLIQNPGARAELGAANRKKANAEFNITGMLERYRALFQSVAARNA